MEILTLESTFKKGKYANKSVRDLVKEKGKIFAMIKEGYYFADDVLEAAHIKKTIRDEKIYNCVVGRNISTPAESLPVEKTSIKQILSELNTLENVGRDIDDDDSQNDYNNEINTNIEDDE